MQFTPSSYASQFQANGSLQFVLHELFFNATVYWNLLSRAVGFLRGWLVLSNPPRNLAWTVDLNRFCCRLLCSINIHHSMKFQNSLSLCLFIHKYTNISTCYLSIPSTVISLNLFFLLIHSLTYSIYSLPLPALIVFHPKNIPFSDNIIIIIRFFASCLFVHCYTDCRVQFEMF